MHIRCLDNFLSKYGRRVSSSSLTFQLSHIALRSRQRCEMHSSYAWKLKCLPKNREKLLWLWLYSSRLWNNSSMFLAVYAHICWISHVLRSLNLVTIVFCGFLFSFSCALCCRWEGAFMDDSNKVIIIPWINNYFHQKSQIRRISELRWRNSFSCW